MSKSALYVANTSNQTVQVDGIITPGTIVRRFGPNLGLAGNAINIGKLLNTRNYYFVPFKQDNPISKPRSIVFESSYIIPTLEMALDGKQIQPILQQL